MPANSSTVSSFEAENLGATLSDATARQGQKRRSMSRRSGQVGTVVKAGKWWRVRFRLDMPGAERRQMSVRVAPAGREKSPPPEVRRKAMEIVASSGANSVEHFRRVVAIEDGLTFREQAKRWLAESELRDKVTPEGALENWINPVLGDMILADVNNGAMKRLVETMRGKLSPQTIRTYTSFVKLVVASALDEDLNELYPRVWKNERIGIPTLGRGSQRQPAQTTASMNLLVAHSEDWQKVLAVLLGASGMRIAEILGLDVRHIVDEGSTIQVRQQAADLQVVPVLKTEAGFRDVDLTSGVASLLGEFIGGRKQGLLFSTEQGTPHLQSNLLRRWLHPLQQDLGLEVCGLHSFRRFRNTHLRKSACPENLRKFWIGHAPSSLDVAYDKSCVDVEWRKLVAEKIGIGFEINAEVVPSAPNVPRAPESEIAVTA